ncbi:MAG: hypothetical protein KKA73_18295 [Chloroflexi bacterium]|nr:hypothetical protein [Chloroflexota bacterium]
MASTTPYQALQGLDKAALTRRLLAGLPRLEANATRLDRAWKTSSWHWRSLNGGERVEFHRPDGLHTYMVAGWPSALTSDPAAPFACSCPDGQRYARYGVRCKHVWGRILTALGRVHCNPAG